MKKVLILTGSDSRMYDVLNLTIPSKERYAKKHAYDLIVKRSFDEEIIKYGLGLGFARAILAFNYLEAYDTVMWIDGDSIITNDSMRIEEFIDDKHCFYASYDWHCHSNSKFNRHSFSTGNFILNKTSTINGFYDKFIDLANEPVFKNDSLAEQGVLNYMKINDIMGESIKILDHNFLNSVPSFMNISNIWINRVEHLEGHWDENCFLAHLTGCPNLDRIKILTESILNKYI
jgi:hypothetical protein